MPLKKSFKHQELSCGSAREPTHFIFLILIVERRAAPFEAKSRISRHLIVAPKPICKNIKFENKI